MAEVVSNLILLAGALVFLIGAVAFYRPLPRLGLRSQKAAAIVAVAGLLVAGAGSSMGSSAVVDRTPVDEVDEVESLSDAVKLPPGAPPPLPVDATAPALAEETATFDAEPHADVANPSPAAGEAFKAHHERFLAYAQPCEDVWRAVSRAAEAQDQLQVYRRAAAGANRCSDLSRDIGALTYTGLHSAAARQMNERVDDCAEAYQNRALSMRSLASAMRGKLDDMARVSVAMELMSAARADTTRCLAAYQVTARALGFETPHLPEPG
jgi:hypothetical protein